MEKKYFITLDTETKTELTWNFGEHITTVEIKDLYISLFLLDSFFIELYINKITYDLLEIKVQDDTDILYAFLNSLDISDLWS
jgi:hypothetical protein